MQGQSEKGENDVLFRVEPPCTHLEQTKGGMNIIRNNKTQNLRLKRGSGGEAITRHLQGKGAR